MSTNNPPTTPDKTQVIEEIVKNLLVEIMEVVGDEFAPKQESGSPERQRLLGLLAQTVPLQIETTHQIQSLISDITTEARIEWLDEQIKHVMFDIYPEDIFTPPTDADYKKANDFDANLHTRLHCDGIRHGLHVLRREVRELSARDDLAQLKAQPLNKRGIV